MTTQRLTSKRLADRGWIVHPRVNRVCMFDGGVLHGVIPGRGAPVPNGGKAPGLGAETDGGRPGGGGSAAASETRPSEMGISGASSSKPAPVGHGVRGETDSGKDLRREHGVQASPRERAGMRVTWMVAFWRDIQARPPPSPPLSASAQTKEPSERRSSPPSGAGAAQPFPSLHAPDGRKDAGEKGRATWPSLFHKKPDGWGGAGARRGAGKSDVEIPVRPVAIRQVWEDVDAAENKRVGAGVSRLKRLPDYDLCFQGF